MNKPKYAGLIFLLSFIVCSKLYAQPAPEVPASAPNGYVSVFTERPDDSLAVYFTPENFPSLKTGSDASEALQQAINRVQETVKYGVLFIPEGTYPISKTIYVWKGVRLIGYGKKRPVFLLAKHTAGFQDGSGKYMFHFCTDRPRGTRPPQDANAGTFYSGMKNVDVRIEPENPAAVAIRFHVAQHGFLSHVNFSLQPGNIAIEDIGNEIEYCRFVGGDYAIKTGKTSPGWQSFVLDSYFDGQLVSAVSTQEAGLMLIRNYFRNTPRVVDITDGFPEELWISDSRFENVKTSAIVVSNSLNPRTQINLENIVCINVPEFLQFRESGEKITRNDKQYLVQEFSHGLQFASQSEDGQVKTTQNILPLKVLPSLVASDVPLLPPVSSWVNLKTLGAKGNGIADDTAILERAIREHDVIFLPGGHYRISRPIVLREHTALLGLHPSLTQLLLRDSTQMYQGAGSPLALLETPKGGDNIVSGIGLNTSGVNQRAVAAIWKAGPHSLLNDVRFVGGHGTYNMQGQDVPVYNDNRTADGLNYRKWDTQNSSLWITDGGGGTFKDIWTPSPYAGAGMHLSNTSTSGRIYCLSSEHHVRSEIILDSVSNWKIFGLQLEEESGEGPYCLPLEIRNSKNVLFANLFSYRVSRVTTPFPYAIKVEGDNELIFKGIHNFSWTKFAFENSLFDQKSGCSVRPREIAFLRVTADKQPSRSAIIAADIIPAGAKVEKLVGGFDCIDGATCDSKGNVYFVESKLHRVYCWGTDDKLSLVCNLPTNPVLLACAANDQLMVVTRFVQEPSAHSRGEIGALGIDPQKAESSVKALREVPFDDVKGKATVYYQATRHRNENNLPKALAEKIETCFISDDESTVIPNTIDIGQTFSLKKVMPNAAFYASTAPGLRTYKCSVSGDNMITSPSLFAETGATDIEVDTQGNVFIPADHIRIFNSAGKLQGTIETPSRPTNILFGGKDKKSLFILGGSSLYRILTVNGGK